MISSRFTSLGRIATLAALFLCIAGASSVALAENPFLRERTPRIVTEIHLFGNTHTKDYIILRELGIKPGDVYDDDVLNDGWTRIEQLDFIAYVDIQQKQPAEGEVILVLNIEEDHRFRWWPGLHYSRRFNFTVSLDGRFSNFRGRGEELWARGEWWKLQSYSAGWKNPWILKGLKLGIGVDGLWEKYNFVFEPFDFNDRRGGGELWRDFWYFRATGAYHYRSNKVTKSIDPNTPDGEYIEPITMLELSFDSRNIRYYPTRGIYAYFRYKWYDARYRVPYQVWTSYASAFYTVRYVGIVGGRVVFRNTDDPMPTWERSYLGGPDTIRGTLFSSVRGDQHFIGTIEIRRPFFLVPLRHGRTVGLGVHAFADWGTAWEYNQTIDDAPMHSTLGVGMHINLNTHNFRFEYAWGDGDDGFLFEDEFTF